jgi:hypothetical protein
VEGERPWICFTKYNTWILGAWAVCAIQVQDWRIFILVLNLPPGMRTWIIT